LLSRATSFGQCCLTNRWYLRSFHMDHAIAF
jgi:hypothetical protein